MGSGTGRAVFVVSEGMYFLCLSLLRGMIVVGSRGQGSGPASPSIRSRMSDPCGLCCVSTRAGAPHAGLQPLRGHRATVVAARGGGRRGYSLRRAGQGAPQLVPGTHTHPRLEESERRGAHPVREPRRGDGARNSPGTHQYVIEGDARSITSILKRRRSLPLPALSCRQSMWFTCLFPAVFVP